MPRRPLTPLDESHRRAQLRELGLDADMLPPSLTEAERKAAMADPIPAPATSPTGTPWLNPKVLPWLGLVLAAATAVATKGVDLFPNTELDQTLAILLVSVLGFISPGLRKSP
jgi:hypothetical protein